MVVKPMKFQVFSRWSVPDYRNHSAIGETLVMCSDGCDDKSKFSGFRLTLAVAMESGWHLAFIAIADGGEVDMPLVKTFWSS